MSVAAAMTSVLVRSSDAAVTFDALPPWLGPDPRKINRIGLSLSSLFLGLKIDVISFSVL